MVVQNVKNNNNNDNGRFWIDVSFFECVRYLVTRKIILKLLRIEMETNHIIMTMGMY
jgi:hypothetical protein